MKAVRPLTGHTERKAKMNNESKSIEIHGIKWIPRLSPNVSGKIYQSDMVRYIIRDPSYYISIYKSELEVINCCRDVKWMIAEDLQEVKINGREYNARHLYFNIRRGGKAFAVYSDSDRPLTDSARSKMMSLFSEILDAKTKEILPDLVHDYAKSFTEDVAQHIKEYKEGIAKVSDEFNAMIKENQS